MITAPHRRTPERRDPTAVEDLANQHSLIFSAPLVTSVAGNVIGLSIRSPR